jgi:hypothetical protein
LIFVVASLSAKQSVGICRCEPFSEAICSYLSLRAFQRSNLLVFVVASLSAKQSVGICRCEPFSEAICWYLSLAFKLLCFNRKDCFAEKARNDKTQKTRNDRVLIYGKLKKTLSPFAQGFAETFSDHYNIL